MQSHLKRLAERLGRHQFWIDRSSDRRSVERLIQSLRPRGTVAPLIRVGPKSDGGYLLPDDLDGVVACISPGVSDQVGFDLTLARRGIDVFMADASVDRPPQWNERFNFTKKFVDVFEDQRHVRLDTLCSTIKGDLILQMDIEGAEWRVLLDASPQTLERFRIMVIEFHNLRHLFGDFSFGLIQATFAKIRQTHTVVHLHPNNICKPTNFHGLSVPTLMEITFYRNDRKFAESAGAVYPHPLDCDCVDGKPSVVLPECWY